MQRRKFLVTAGGIATSVGLAGCTGGDNVEDEPDTTSGTESEDSSETSSEEGGEEETTEEETTEEESEPSMGTLATHVSDQPNDIGDFEHLIVKIDTITVFPQEGDPIDIDGGGAEADLTQLQGDDSKLVTEAELEAQTFEQMHVGISDDIDAKLKDGGEPDVKLPSGKLKFNREFDIRGDYTTHFTADFAPVKRGKTGKYNIQPVAKEVEVDYEYTGEGEPPQEDDSTTTEDDQPNETTEEDGTETESGNTTETESGNETTETTSNSSSE